MCGIVGFLGNENAYEKIINGLIQLQNRGYDSAGISVIQDNNIQIKKYATVDKITALDKLAEFAFNSTIGIGHTRWATHGAKTDINSHPHISYDNKFALVHNGIIENYQELKLILSEKGINHISQTDTEVIVNLIAYYFKENNNVTDTLEYVTKLLKGTWGIGLLYIDEPKKIYCTRHGSPLLIGIDDSNAMITSEQSGFCNLFTKYIVLNNNDISCIEKDKTGKIIFHSKDVYVEKNAIENNNSLTPDPYDHWTIKEIYEQVDSSLRAISLGGRILSNNEVNLGGLKDAKEPLCNIDNIIILGCGTSYHSGMFGMQFYKELCDFNSVQLFDGAEFSYFDIPKKGFTGMILISQSGETKDLHRCIKIASENNIYMIGVVNVVDSLIAREVHSGCYLNAGREVAVASTKAYTSQIILLTMISVWFAQHKELHVLKRDRIVKDLRVLHLDIEKTLNNCYPIVKSLIYLFKNQDHCFILGKGKGESVAREGALKIKEISYIHAEGYSTSSLKHGPFALLQKGFPVILIAPEDEFYAKSMNAYEEMKSRYAEIIVITDKQDCDLPNTIIIPYNLTFRHLLSIIPLQLFAYELSLSRGLNPDMPRNLAKVVTVE